MTINGILNNALSGLSTSQQALRTTTDNITNVNTPGYVRKITDFQTRVVGGGSAGVEIAGIQRIVDKFLLTASYKAASDSGRYEAVNQMHVRLQTLFGRPDENTSLSGRVDTVFAALADAAIEPNSVVRRQATVAALEDFGAELARVSDKIQDLRAEASDRIAQDVLNINAALQQIHHLNPLITREYQMGGDSSALEEARSKAIKELSHLLDIRVIDTGTGAVHISTGGGVTLLDGSLYKVSYNPPGSVAPDTIFPRVKVQKVDPTTGAVTGIARDLDPSILSGELRGLLDMRDDTLPALSMQVGELAGQMIDGINAIHNDNVAFPPLSALTGRASGLLGADLHGFTGQARFAVIDSSGYLMNSVTVDFDALGAGATINDVVAAVNAGLGGAATLSFANGVMKLSSANPANGVAVIQEPGDPSSRGGRGFSHFFGLNDLLVSDAAAHYDTGFSTASVHGFTAGGVMALEFVSPKGGVVADYALSIGGATFGDLISNLNANLGSFVSFSLNADGALVATPVSGFENYKIRVKSDSTVRSAAGTTLSGLFGLGDRYKAHAASGIAIAKGVADNNLKLAFAKVNLGAAVGEPVVTQGDSAGVLGLSEVARGIISFNKVGGLNSITTTLSQYGAMILGNAGVESAQAEKLASDNRSLKDEVERRLSDASGVNLDEELSNMIVYQNAYNAAARIITTAQEMYDALLSSLR